MTQPDATAVDIADIAVHVEDPLAGQVLRGKRLVALKKQNQRKKVRKKGVH